MYLAASIIIKQIYLYNIAIWITVKKCSQSEWTPVMPKWHYRQFTYVEDLHYITAEKLESVDII